MIWSVLRVSEEAFPNSIKPTMVARMYNVHLKDVEYGVYRNLIMFLGNFIFYLHKGKCRQAAFRTQTLCPAVGGRRPQNMAGLHSQHF